MCGAVGWRSLGRVYRRCLSILDLLVFITILPMCCQFSYGVEFTILEALCFIEIRTATIAGTM